MTQAKAGQEIEEKSCDNPVQEHMALGQMLGVRGTPALVLESGRMVPGYVPAQRLLSFLEDDSADK
jgi:thiol:disulfide interchange protein DsbC